MNQRIVWVLLLPIALAIPACVKAQTAPPVVVLQYQPTVPDSPERQARLAQADQLEKSAAQKIDAGEYAAAEADARKSLALSTVGHSQNLLAQALYAQGKASEALPLYRSLTGSEDPRVLLPYAMLLLKSGRWEEAVVAYNTAMTRMDDQNPDTHLGPGDLVETQYHFTTNAYQPGAMETAIHLAMGVEYNARLSWAQNLQNDKALAEYRQALSANPYSGIANYYYGYGLQKAGQVAKAQKAFKQAVAAGKGNVKAAAQAALDELDKRQKEKEQVINQKT